MPIDYKKYPPNWKAIRQRILIRAKHCCEFCGVKNYAIKNNGTKVVLTIAHLDHDSDNHNIQDDRLKALCQACHLRYDLPRKITKRKYGADFYKNARLFK